MRDLFAVERGLVLFPAASAGSHEDNTPVAASLQAELMKLGYALDAAAFERAKRAPRAWLASYHAEVLPHLRKRLGAGRQYAPFYRNFPAEVMAKSDAELFVNAIVHYWSLGTWEPPQELKRRGFAFEDVHFKSLRPGTEEDLKRLFTQLASINQSLTQQDKDMLAWLIDTYRGELRLPPDVPFKETLCLLAAKGLDVPLKTPTDVLRVAVYMSGGDVSLPGVPKPEPEIPEQASAHSWWVKHLRESHRAAREKFKFRKFKRPERRMLLGLLERTTCDATEMQRHLGRWLRLGEVLHPGEQGLRFPRAAEAFQRLRNQRRGTKLRTFAARVDLAFRANWREGVDLLATRPGEFARRLDWILRTFGGPADARRYVLDVLTRAAPGVSAKVLFELYDHFARRYKPGSPRVVMLKARGKMKTLEPLPPMDADLVQHVGNTILAVLRGRMAKLPAMGRVWVDERLRDVPAPFAMRSVNTAVRTYVRGTRVPFRPEARVVRAFIHWLDENGDQDIDLSAGLYDASLKLVTHISFTNLKEDQLGCCHSGDIRWRRGPCAEYVDVDVERCLAAGVRYAVVQVFNYESRPMHTVKECVFGLMEREHAEANEIFVPKTISNCMPLANEGTSVVACVIDLERSNYIWADVESDRGLATLENAAGRTAEVLRALVEGTRMSVYDLLMLHVRARGTPVDVPTGADVALRWEDFVTSYQRVAEYMNV